MRSRSANAYAHNTLHAREVTGRTTTLSNEEVLMKRVRWLMLALVLATAGVAAQEYQSKPMRLLVPYPPGGPVDAVSRLVAKDVSLGQNMIVDNRSGGGGSVGAEVVAKSPPDGYTML